MKAGIFEVVKARFVKELQDVNSIQRVDNAEAAKASTESSGEACFEYSMSVTFQIGENIQTFKLTVYTTTCSIMVQQIGEPPEVKEHLGLRCTSKYFMDTYFVPWGEKIIEKNYCTGKSLVKELRIEIKRLDHQKLEEKKVSSKERSTVTNLSVEGPDSKCVAKTASTKD